MFIIGHRGACGYAPENTISSFQKALSLGVDAIELDVHMSKDNQIVVIHDDSLFRTTNGTGYVSDFTYSELCRFDAGGGEKIPLLTDVLDVVDRRCVVNIELKGENTAQYVSKCIADYREIGWDENLFIVSSSNEFLLQTIAEYSPSIRRGYIYSGIPLEYAKIADKTGSKILCLDKDFINTSFVEDAHSRDILVYVRTINDMYDMEKMHTLGVDGIFTNFPDRFK